MLQVPLEGLVRVGTVVQVHVYLVNIKLLGFCIGMVDSTGAAVNMWPDETVERVAVGELGSHIDMTQKTRMEE